MPPLTAGCREDWAEEGLVRISLVTVESPPPLVTLLRAALPAEGLCCDLAAEEPPLLIGCATLVPVPEEVRLDDETVELPEVLVPVPEIVDLVDDEEEDPRLTCEEPEGRLAAGREVVADERVVLPVEREVVAEERPVVVRFWVVDLV